MQQYGGPPQGPPQGYGMPPQGYGMPPQGYSTPPPRPPQGYNTGPPQGYGGPPAGPPPNFGGPPNTPPPGYGPPPVGPRPVGYRDAPPIPPSYRNGNGYNGGDNGYRSDGYNDGNNNGYRNDGYNGQYGNPNAEFHRPPSAPQSFGVQGYNFQYSNCTGRRKALLVGINYYGQKNQLRGCINDIENVKQFLLRHGYKEQDMVMLRDDSRDGREFPTRENILRGMRWLVEGAQTHDSLFLHYSGHGGQTEDLDGDEDSGFDDVIYPVDYTRAGHIVDDEIHATVVRPLMPGVRLTALFDCCHSGTAMDLPYVYSTKGVLKEPNLLKDTGTGLMSAAGSYVSGDINGVVSSVSGILRRVTHGNSGYEKSIQTKTAPSDCIMFSGCKDSQTSADSFENGQATGAMSHAFITVMNTNPNQSYLTLLQNMRSILQGKYSQKPQLSASHPIDCNLRFIF